MAIMRLRSATEKSGRCRDTAGTSGAPTGAARTCPTPAPAALPRLSLLAVPRSPLGPSCRRSPNRGGRVRTGQTRQLSWTVRRPFAPRQSAGARPGTTPRCPRTRPRRPLPCAGGASTVFRALHAVQGVPGAGRRRYGGRGVRVQGAATSAGSVVGRRPGGSCAGSRVTVSRSLPAPPQRRHPPSMPSSTFRNRHPWTARPGRAPDAGRPRPGRAHPGGRTWSGRGSRRQRQARGGLSGLAA